MLLPGEKRIFYVCIPVPEDRTEEVGFELTARAYPQNTDQNTEKEDHDPGDFSSEEASQTVPDEISRTITVKTEIQALKADFQVTGIPGRGFFILC